MAIKSVDLSCVCDESGHFIIVGAMGCCQQQ